MILQSFSFFPVFVPFPLKLPIRPFRVSFLAFSFSFSFSVRSFLQVTISLLPVSFLDSIPVLPNPPDFHVQYYQALAPLPPAVCRSVLK